MTLIDLIKKMFLFILVQKDVYIRLGYDTAQTFWVVLNKKLDIMLIVLQMWNVACASWRNRNKFTSLIFFSVVLSSYLGNSKMINKLLLTQLLKQRKGLSRCTEILGTVFY